LPKNSYYTFSCVTETLLALLGLFVFIQLFYYLFVFSRLMRYEQPVAVSPQPAEGVSVLVCAWDELENLKELLPLLDAQEYALFEVLVLDDRSSDGTEKFLKEEAHVWPHVRFIRIDKEFPHITPKKYALTVGMKHARYPVALMTDADCRPTGSSWIASMVGQLQPDRDIVLGFSPYYKEKGLLNWFIRCETFYTAVQYLSLARVGRPYMGVGRNLMYRTALFFEHKGFYQHKHIVGGDDDLFMNQAATPTNTAINLDPESFVYSFPKTTWDDWLRQKRRHLSVGNYYQRGNKIRLGVLSGSHVGVWGIGIVALLWGMFTHDLLLLKILGGVFSLRWLVQWIVLGGINTRLDRTLSGLSFIPMDLAFFVYYVGMSGLVLSRKRKKLLWR
jgi:glycosyltransferase involved in cell wall biosynthesis